MIGLTAACEADMLPCERVYLTQTAKIKLIDSQIEGNNIGSLQPISLEEFMKDNGAQARLAYIDKDQEEMFRKEAEKYDYDVYLNEKGSAKLADLQSKDLLLVTE